MKVLDAGVVVGLLAGGLDPEVVGDEDWAAPHLIDSEVTHVLRGLALRGVLTQEAATAALAGFAELSITRFPAHRLRERMWALRRNLSAYDATYVALAEAIDATELLTTDAALTRAPGIRCPIRLI